MPASFIVPVAAKRPFFRAPDGWDDVWRAAIFNSNNQQAIWGIMGDSNSSGFDSAQAQYQVATNWYTRRWSSQVASKLVARAPGGLSGEYFHPSITNNTYFANASHHASPAWISPAGAVGTANLIGYPGGFQQTMAALSATGVGWAWEFNSANVGAGLSFTDVDILNVDLNGGTFQYRIDGGSATTVTTGSYASLPTSVFGFGPGRVVRRQITGLSSATHTVDFGNASGVQAMQLAGVNCYPSSAARSKGVFTANYSIPGYDMASMIVTNGASYMQPEVWSGFNGALAITAITNAIPSVVTTGAVAHGRSIGDVVRIGGATTPGSNGEYVVAAVGSSTTLTLDNIVLPGGTSSAGTLTTMSPQLGPPTGCHLMVIINYANDMQYGRGLDSSYEATRRLCQAARRAVDGCAFLFIVHELPDPRSNEATLAADNIQNWYQYMDLMVSMADSFGGALYNFGAVLGSTPVSKGYVPRGEIHLNDAGHTYLANQLAQYIVP